MLCTANTFIKLLLLLDHGLVLIVALPSLWYQPSSLSWLATTALTYCDKKPDRRRIVVLEIIELQVTRCTELIAFPGRSVARSASNDVLITRLKPHNFANLLVYCRLTVVCRLLVGGLFKPFDSDAACSTQLKCRSFKVLSKFGISKR